MSKCPPWIDPATNDLRNESNNNLMDITFLIDQCASNLSFQNPMISTPNFSLQDSMAALELMDAKMDCCEIPASQVGPYKPCDGEKEELMVFPRPPPRGLDDPITPLPWETLTLRDAAWIGLESLARLESFLNGASAVESTFTCLYLHSPVLEDMKRRLSMPPTEVPSSLTERLLNLVLETPATKSSSSSATNPNSDNEDDVGTPAQYAVFAMSLAFLELTDVVRNICTNADIYEEEDFSVNTYGIPIYADRDEHTVLSLLKDVMAIFEDLKGAKGDDETDADQIQAILLILRFQLDFLMACTTMGGLSSENTQEAAAETKRVVLSGQHCLEQLQDILKRMRAEESDHDKALMRSAFDSFVNRPLVGNAPVRKVIFNHAEDSIPVLIKIISEIDWCVCDLLIRGDTLGRIRRMLERVSSASANILSRSLIVLNLYFDERLLGKMTMPDLILYHMKQLAHAPDTIFQETYGEAYLNRLAKPVYDTLKLLTLNRNRQRTYMEAVMLQDWSALQQEAHAVDANFQKEVVGPESSSPPYFTHYVLSTTLMLLDLHVKLGIEQKLFHGSHDLAVGFWYRDFLLSSQLNNATTMRRMKVIAKALEQQSQPQPATEASKNSRSGKKKGKQNHSKTAANGTKAEDNNSDNSSKLEDLEDEIEILVLGVKRGLSRGLVRFIAALTQADMVKPETFEFTSHEQRFSKQFDAFSLFIQPPPLTYNDFCHGSDFSRVTQQDLVVSTTECFKASKEMIDKLLLQMAEIEPCFRPIQEDEVRQLAKVCIGNSAFVQRLVQMVDSSGKAQGTVSFDLSTHARFCTIRLR